MVSHDSVISESEVSITVLCLLLYVHPVTQQYESRTVQKVRLYNQSSHYENTMVLRALVVVWNWSIHCPSLSAMFDSLHSSTNQELFGKHLCNQGSHYGKCGQFLVMQRKPSHTTTKLTLFTVSKDEWNTKEDTGKSLKKMHCTYCDMSKGTSQAETMLNSEKIKPVALAVIELS